jgi:membrane complex biogenesis BtpA family protein
MRPFDATFGSPRVLIGMLHVAALPGTPSAGAGVESVAERAADEARVFERAGFHAVMIENMHDRPYLKAAVGPEIVAAMTRVAVTVRSAVRLPVGVQVLAAANREALAVAHAAGAAFVRVEGFVFSHVADEGLVDGCAGELLRYRRAIGAERVLVFADVKKKHAAHAITSDVDVVETARAAEFFLADGVIVTGTTTGREADPADVDVVARAVSVPVIVGSGTTPENIANYPAADGFIVGSALKRHGLWSNPIDPQRVDAVLRAFGQLDPRP